MKTIATKRMQQRMTALETEVARLRKAIEQVNLNDAERYRLTRDQIRQLMQEMRKPRKARKRLNVKEPPISCWQW